MSSQGYCELFGEGAISAFVVVWRVTLEIHPGQVQG